MNWLNMEWGDTVAFATMMVADGLCKESCSSNTVVGCIQFTTCGVLVWWKLPLNCTAYQPNRKREVTWILFFRNAPQNSVKPCTSTRSKSHAVRKDRYVYENNIYTYMCVCVCVCHVCVCMRVCVYLGDIYADKLQKLAVSHIMGL